MKIKELLLTVLVASAASYATLYFAGATREPGSVTMDMLTEQLAQHDALRLETGSAGLSFTAESEEDAWLMGVGTDGLPRPGPADDVKSLVEAKDAVCFLTDVEFMGMNDAGDQLACRVSIDEFTGFWEVHAVQGDGTDASVRCNASCLVIQ